MFISHMQPCCLEWYKQMDEKRALLDAAIATCDGNCITTILLFIRKTLEFSMYSWCHYSTSALQAHSLLTGKSCLARSAVGDVAEAPNGGTALL